MHNLKRHLEKTLEKRAHMFPVLGVLGPRQVGKSTFLMNDWAKLTGADYLTFDAKEVVIRAQRAPAQLLMEETRDMTSPLIIDEAHKVPHIFDSIKALVDQKRRLGMFTLSGSVEFSSRSGVRESLAGRIGITRLYPLTIRELNDEPFQDPWVTRAFSSRPFASSKSIETWMERGGMPIFCGISDEDERMQLIHSWLDAICYRDLMQLKDAHYNSEIAYYILNYLATHGPKMSVLHMAQELGTTPSTIKKHLTALEALFLIYKLPSLTNTKASPKYMLFDAGVYNALHYKRTDIFSKHTNLLMLIINEIYAQYEYAGKLKPKLFYYESRSGSAIDLVLQTKECLIGIQCMTSVDISEYAQRSMHAFLERYPLSIGYIIAPVQKAYAIAPNLHVIPWNQCV